MALIVLLLAPEAYWPLRRVGAEFHAAAEGAAAFASAGIVLECDTAPSSFREGDEADRRSARSVPGLVEAECP